MPRTRLTQHGMDVVFKLEAQQLGSALARRFGIDLPPVVRYFPTDLPVADVHLEQLDSVFELADERLFHLEFQTEHRRVTLPRFLVYDAYLIERYGRPIVTVVFYGAGVTVAASEIKGGSIKYNVINVLLGEQDGEETYRRLRDLVAREGGLRPEDRLDLIFLPLMRHTRPRREVVIEAVALARQLPERQQRQTVASLIGLGSHFLNDIEIDTLMEGLMSTSIGQRLMERGLERGIEQGRQEGRQEGIEQGLRMGRQAVLRVLSSRFSPVPPQIEGRLARVDDLQRLDALVVVALSVQNVEDFTRALE